MVWVELDKVVLQGELDLTLVKACSLNHAVELVYLDTTYGLQVRLQASISEERVLIQTWLKHTGSSSIMVKRIILVFTNHARSILREEPRDWRLYIDSGTNAWCGVKRLNAIQYDRSLLMVEAQRTLPFERQDQRFHESDLLTVIYDAISQRALLFGALGSITTQPTIEVRPDQTGDNLLDIRMCIAFDAEFSPTMELEADPMVVLASTNPLNLMETYAELVQTRYRSKSLLALPEQPIVGYMSWYGYGTAITEQIILDNARAAAEVFDGYPQPMRRVMLIDHGWQWQANWGKWDASDPRRFPSGIASLGRDLASMGWELGLWYTPFCVTVDSPEHERLSPLLATDQDGRLIEREASVWGYNPEEGGVRRPIHFLDSAMPEALAEIRANLERMKDWGVTFWKLDFFAVTTSAVRQSKISRASLFQRVGEVIRDAIRLDDVVMPCSTPTNQLLGMCNLINIPADTGNAGKWPAHKLQFRRSYETAGSAWFKHGKFWINDHQSVQLGEGCSLGEARIRATMIAMSGGSLWLSEDITQLPPDRVQMVQRMLPVYGKAARPLDLFTKPYPDAYPRLWALPVQTDWDFWIALAVFNFDETPYHADLNASLFGIEENTTFEAMEWWTSRRLGRHVGQVTVHVPPEDVAIVLAKPLRDTPWVLGADLHFTGGWVIENVCWDEKTLEICGEVVTRPGMHGNIYGTHPAHFTISPKMTQQARDNGNLGWHLRIKTTGQRSPFRVPFTRVGDMLEVV
jgi:hypothetical protein